MMTRFNYSLPLKLIIYFFGITCVLVSILSVTFWFDSTSGIIPWNVPEEYNANETFRIYIVFTTLCLVYNVFLLLSGIRILFEGGRGLVSAQITC